MKKQISIFALALLMSVPSITFAQNVDSKWGIGIYGGKNEYSGDYGSTFLSFDRRFFELSGASLNRYLNPTFDLGAYGSLGNYGYAKSGDWSSSGFQGTKGDLSLLLSLKLNNGWLLKEDSKFSPSIVAGAGGAWYYGNIPNKKELDILLPVGLGLKYSLNHWLALQYMGTMNLTNSDIRDNFKSNVNDAFFKHTLGVVLTFEKMKDADGDRVKDELDMCPTTPANVEVDAKGCPLDVDGDGVADYIDKCPSEAGLVQFNGCPDRDADGVADIDDKCADTPKEAKVDSKGCPVDGDADGIADYLDKCPNLSGPAKFNGCPDTDGDGIADINDRCPKDAGSAAFEGCPDTDSDGVADNKDRCPRDAGSKSLEGCPDGDADGVADIDDKCADAPGLKSNKGCPEVKEEVKKIFTEALSGIKFELGKDKIAPSSFGILDKVVKVMNENPTYNLKINGHTDNVGVASANLTLSQKRAEAVKAYMTNKGVAATRMESTGFGDTVPVADNATAAGRTQNRRVEFVVVF